MVIGKGSYGEVWLARHIKDKRPVILYFAYCISLFFFFVYELAESFEVCQNVLRYLIVGLSSNSVEPQVDKGTSQVVGLL